MRALLLSILALMPVFAVAQEIPPGYKRYAVTISPVHLSLPIVEITGEYRLDSCWSVAGIAGKGSFTGETDPGVEETLDAQELGAQVRYYPKSPRKHEPHIGAELLWLHLSGDIDNVSGSGTGLAVGPFVGYKYTANFGLTFDAQLGFQRLVVRAEASDGSTSASGEDSDFIPLLNLNLGWSF